MLRGLTKKNLMNQSNEQSLNIYFVKAKMLELRSPIFFKSKCDRNRTTKNSRLHVLVKV